MPNQSALRSGRENSRGMILAVKREEFPEGDTVNNTDTPESKQDRDH